MKKKKQEREMENFLEVLIRNYKTVPGFKIILKLGFYTIFIIFFISIISISNHNKKVVENKTTTTTISLSKVYRDMISDLANVKKEVVTLNQSKLNLDINDIISGYLENDTDIKKVIIKDNKLYEIINNEEIENNLFGDITYLNINEMIKYLFNNKSVKVIENNITIYKYDILNVYIDNDKIDKIMINNSYVINYE